MLRLGPWGAWGPPEMMTTSDLGMLWLQMCLAGTPTAAAGPSAQIARADLDKDFGASEAPVNQVRYLCP